MACKNCEKIRSLLLHGKMAEAVGLTVETFREKIGYKVVQEDETVDGLRTTVAIDADSDHRKQTLVVGEQAPEAPAKRGK